MRRALTLTFTLLLVPLLPVLHAAPIDIPPAAEVAVEGHTVYAVLEMRWSTSTWTRWDPAIATVAAGASTASAAEAAAEGSRAGVRWFNDQDLVSARQAGFRGAAVAVLVEERATQYVNGWPHEDVRRPCVGAVILTDASYALDPVLEFRSWPPPTYVGSYVVTDPADHEWTIDEWRGADGPLWVAPINGRSASMGTPDDGASDCRPAEDRASAAPEGDHGLAYPGRTGPLPFPLPTEGGLEYNALLYVPLDLLRSDAQPPRDHAEGAPHRTSDATGCHEEACPSGDDDAEGNSHPHNWAPDLISVRPFDHGASADCTSDGRGDHACHATRGIRLHYGTAPQPPFRMFTVVDLEGSSADW